MDREAGLTLYLMEELSDARLRCDQLKRYVDQATKLISKSPARDHFIEVAGHLIEGIPKTLFLLEKSLQATALAASKMDYEELKLVLKPEKVEDLEQVMEEARLRLLRRRGNPMPTPKSTAAELRTLVASLESSTPPSPADVVGHITKIVGTLSTQPKVASDPVSLAFDDLQRTLKVTADRLEEQSAKAHKLYKGTYGETNKPATRLELNLIGNVLDAVAMLNNAAKQVDQLQRKVKTAATAEEDKESRHEEGKSVDPTKDMSPEDAAKWKAENEKNKDKFKNASRFVPIEKAKKGDMVEIEVGTPWPRDSKKEKVTGKVVRVKSNGFVTVDVEKTRANPGGHSNEDVDHVDIRLPKKAASVWKA